MPVLRFSRCDEPAAQPLDLRLFHPSLAATIRGGGFRPVVFLHHGLWLGVFLCMAVLGACTLWRQALRDRVRAAPWLAAMLWLALTLVLSRNLGATALMLLFAPVILFAPPRLQVLVAAVFAGMVLTYPMLRGRGWCRSARSTRSQNLSAKTAPVTQIPARQRGYAARPRKRETAGRLGRLGARPSLDPETGRDLSVTDGLWVIIIGSFGWVGYVAQFGLLAMPLLMLARRRGAEIAPITAGVPC